MKNKRALLPPALWLSAMLVCLLLIAQTRFVTDLSAFMPKTPNARQQLLIEQLRDGAVARLIMIGIDGGDAPERARLSRELNQALQKTDLFVAVQNGQEETLEHDRAYFFDNRYLLSPAVTPARFEADGLHGAISGSIEALSGDAGMSLKRLFGRDPTGETLQLVEQLQGPGQPQNVEGVWASRDGQRALLLALTRAAGSDTEAQSLAVETVRNVFAALPGRSNDARLVMSGAGVSSAASRNTIEKEVSRLATASFVLVVCLLLVVYRSALLLLLGSLPVLSGVAAGIAAVSLGFGQVHGLTLGFGTTLIGEAVDYSIYFFVQRTSNQDSANHARNFWRTIWLGMLTSIVGFAALLSSSFPGLAQLGLYSIVGLVAAVLVTRYVLPVLTPKTLALRDLRQVGAQLDRGIERAAVLRWPLAGLAVAACVTIYAHQGSIWNRALSGLNPIPKSEQRVDEQLRGDLGGTDSRYIMALTAKDQETALQQAEKVGAVFQKLTQDQVMAGFTSPASVLPSIALQRQRQAALPNAEQADQRLQQALQGLPVKAERLGAFLADLQAAREHPPLVRKDLDGTAVAMMVDTMLIQRANDYLVLMPLRAMTEGPSADSIALDVVNDALRAQGLDNATVIDMVDESSSLFDGYRHEVLWLAGLGCVFILVLLLASLRSWVRTLRVAAPLACSVVCVTAALLLHGTSLTILHLVGLLLVVAIGTNYALFFDRGAQTADPHDRHQTQVSLLVANLTAVGSFGVLGLSDVPVLAAIGSTVAPGTFFALVFAAILTRERSGAPAH
ncbi:MMPL family transporter [Rhodoferax saidenbachensis]|uniref:Exporter n=1 Tax=Rhodoferax saidenbachensis TaxID=1484693 RepID=A0ABU1ZMG5_9BURK|nr:MMPL family transporter [Rhodoferax saidenbachensis]MDR7306100.1 putative exporter [Rhodoferax saidenbachensis]